MSETRREIRDVVREAIRERGHSIAAAEREMGLREKSLWEWLAGKTVSLAEGTCERLADYLGLPYRAVRRWVRRDGCRIQRAGDHSKRVTARLAKGYPLLTCWGIVEEPISPPYQGCKSCEAREECERAVAVGRPLLCERMLEQELVPAHALAQLGQEGRWA